MNGDFEQQNLDRRLRLPELQLFIERLMCHSVLQEERVLPTVSSLQSTLGAIILSSVSLRQSVKDRILAAMVLMYHGLSMHQSMGDATQAQGRRGQLTVLGGDFLSSMFYKLLAETERVDLIKAFSKAVAAVNVSRTAMHQAQFNGQYGPEQYLADAHKVHGSLLLALCEAVHCNVQVKELVEAAISSKVLDAELSRAANSADMSLVNIMLYEAATLEERVQFFSGDKNPSSHAVFEKRFRSLHSKYDTFFHLIHSFRQSITQFQTLAIDMFGYDGWLQLQRLFPSSSVFLRDGSTVVEGG